MNHQVKGVEPVGCSELQLSVSDPLLRIHPTHLSPLISPVQSLFNAEPTVLPYRSIDPIDLLPSAAVNPE